MSYSTGEIAALCQVIVRTVQFYDKEGLLKPETRSEGGRRLYGEDGLKTLQMICLYKRLGLNLAEIFLQHTYDYERKTKTERNVCVDVGRRFFGGCGDRNDRRTVGRYGAVATVCDCDAVLARGHRGRGGNRL